MRNPPRHGKYLFETDESIERKVTAGITSTSDVYGRILKAKSTLYRTSRETEAFYVLMKKAILPVCRIYMNMRIPG